MKICNDCSIILTNENWPKYAQNKRQYKCKFCVNKSKNKNRKIKKEKALIACGGACICCGENIISFLNIDHINGSGIGDRVNFGLFGISMHAAIVSGRYKDVSSLRTLCYNCNCSRGNSGFCPHEFNKIENKDNCFMCNKRLIDITIGGRKVVNNQSSIENYHPLLKKSNINICFECIYFKKNGKKLITRNDRKEKVKILSRRFRVIEAYGGKCECCGISDYLFLTVDHINYFDGLRSQKLFVYLIKNNFPKDNYRLLCYNCNCGRGHNGSDGICPHKKENIIRISATSPLIV